MKRWAILVAGLYFLILAALTVPVCRLAFPSTKFADVIEAYSAWGYWVWLLVMFLGQAALLAVPVRIASRRPIARRSLLPTILASGLMLGVLAFGAMCALYEFAFTFESDPGVSGSWCAVGIVLLTWCLWSLIFMRQGRACEPKDLVSRQCRSLFKGSVLELLVAIPTHIVARHRDQCCAGCMTFVGLVAGLSVMLFSFGPAVFFLFAARWRKLHPEGGRQEAAGE
jgi:hypothetical protein